MVKHYAPVYGINQYVQELLRTNVESWPVSGIPIIPASQQPEYTDYSDPFIVYTFALDNPGDLYALENATMAYTVYANTVGEVDEIVTVLAHALGRLDDSATDVNSFVQTSAPVDVRDKLGGTRYRSIQLVSAQGAGPETGEGGRHDGAIVLRFRYVADRSAITTRL